MIGPSGLIEFSQPHLAPSDYGYLLSWFFSRLQTPLMSREIAFLVFLIMLNLKAGICYDFPWMPDEIKEWLLFLIGMAEQMKQQGASDEEVNDFIKNAMLQKDEDEDETKFEMITRYLRGFLLDWVAVGDEKKTPIYFRTFDDAYNLLFKDLIVKIGNSTYNFSFFGLMHNCVFGGAEYDASYNCMWKTYMFKDPLSKEAQRATIKDFETWCAQKFEGLSWKYTQNGQLDFDSVIAWFDRYKTFEGIDKVIQLAFDMLVHLRFICKGVNSFEWSSPITQLGNQGYIYLKNYDLYTTTQNWDVQEDAVLSTLPSSIYWSNVAWSHLQSDNNGYISYKQSWPGSQLRTQFRWPQNGGFSHALVKSQFSGFTSYFWSLLSAFTDIPAGQPGHLTQGWEPLKDYVSISFGGVEPGEQGSDFMTHILDYAGQISSNLASGWQLYPFVSGFANPLSGLELSEIESEYVTYKRPSREGQSIEERISLRGGYVVFDMEKIDYTFGGFLNDAVLRDYLTPLQEETPVDITPEDENEDEDEIIDLTPDDEE